MTSTIEVAKTDGDEFRVQVSDSKSARTYRVTLKHADYDRIAGGKATPEELIRRSFEFLLENEPKESILVQFDLPVIGRYFPNYESEIKRRLAQKQ